MSSPDQDCSIQSLQRRQPLGQERLAPTPSGVGPKTLRYALTRKTPKVTMVTDACHSGGGVRGPFPRQAEKLL